MSTWRRSVRAAIRANLRDLVREWFGRGETFKACYATTHHQFFLSALACNTGTILLIIFNTHHCVKLRHSVPRPAVSPMPCPRCSTSPTSTAALCHGTSCLLVGWVGAVSISATRRCCTMTLRLSTNARLIQLKPKRPTIEVLRRFQTSRHHTLIT